METLDSQTTALVLIDLQKGILANPRQPHSVEDVLSRCTQLLTAFRQQNALVVLVHVGWSAGMKEIPPQLVDEPSVPKTGVPAEFSDLVPKVEKNDLVILKHQWGAFYGTELDLQLRRRGIKTIVLGGVATNFGVESTGREAWERNYHVVFAEDAMSGAKAEMHQFAVSTIFPRIGRVRSTQQILESLQVDGAPF